MSISILLILAIFTSLLKDAMVYWCWLIWLFNCWIFFFNWSVEV